MASTALRLRSGVLSLRPFSFAYGANTFTSSATTITTGVDRDALFLLRSEKDPTRILQMLRSTPPNPSTHHGRLALSAAVSNLAAANQTSSICCFLSTLPDSPTAIVLFGEAGMLDEALHLFVQGPHSTKALNAFLFACILCNKHLEAIRHFREFSRRYRIIPDVRTYNTVIKAFSQSNSSLSVFALLEEMERRGVKPNTTSYNTFLSGLYKEEKFEEIERVLRLMKSNNCHPGISTQNVRIQSLCKLKKSQEAMMLLEKMKSRGMKPNTVTYGHLIHGYCREGDLTKAKNVFDEMSQMGCVPDSECYFTLIYYFCKGGELEDAMRFYRQSMKRNWIPRFSVMKTLVSGLVDALRIEEAWEIIKTVKEKFPENSGIWKQVEENFLSGR